MIRNKRRAIPNFFILLVLAIGIGWTFGRFIHWGNVEFTDNAQVKQHLTPVNTLKESASMNISGSRKVIRW